MPSKIRLVAFPRIFGAIEESTTLAVTKAKIRTTIGLSGLKRPRRRLSEGPKFMAFFVGSPPPGGPMGGEEVGRLLMMRPVRLAERRRFRRRWDN